MHSFALPARARPEHALLLCHQCQIKDNAIQSVKQPRPAAAPFSCLRRRRPQQLATTLRPTIAAFHIRLVEEVVFLPHSLRALRVVVDRQLLVGGDVSNGEEGEVIHAAVGEADQRRVDAAVGLAGVVDEARRAAELGGVDLVHGDARFAVAAFVVEVVFEAVEGEGVGGAVGVGGVSEFFALVEFFGGD